jgi:hypothetical protein
MVSLKYYSPELGEAYLEEYASGTFYGWMMTERRGRGGEVEEGKVGKVGCVEGWRLVQDVIARAKGGAGCPGG